MIRRTLTRGVLSACALPAWSIIAFALNPALDVSQYAHNSWKIRDGFARSDISSIAQDTDGYLWFGTDFGLYRFDGVRNAAWQPPGEQRLPSDRIRALMAARDGTLWIGTQRGLASWKNGKMAQYPELAGLVAYQIIEDHEGSIWLSASAEIDGKLCELRDASVRCSLVSAGRNGKVTGLYEDRRRNLWVGTVQGVWRWRPGPPEFYAAPDPNGIRVMADDEDGALLIAMPGGIRRLAGGKLQMAYAIPSTLGGLYPNRMVRDRDGGLWVATQGGIVHIHRGRTELFSQSDGLTGDGVTAVFEDHEGNIWGATLEGLDRFRELPVATYSVNQGFSNLPSGALLRSKDGSIWVGAMDGLNRLNEGRVVVYHARSGRTRTGAHEIAVSGMPDRMMNSLFEDSRGRIWLTTATRTGYLDEGHFIGVAAPGGIVHGIAEDTAGTIWFSNQAAGLVELPPDLKARAIPWAALNRTDSASAVAADPARGGLWLGFVQGGLLWFRDRHVRASYSSADGLGGGRISNLRFDREGALWAATEGGLSRIKEGSIATLTSRNGLPCDAVHWTIEDDSQSVWLMMPCGLARVPKAELDAWAAAADKPGWMIHNAVFDGAAGLGLSPQAAGFAPQVAKLADGTLWFYNRTGAGVVDPRHLPFNKQQPPVHIEQIIADRKTYDASPNRRLPPLVRDLEIDYTALSLVAPEKIHFRYKLDGQDRDWKEVVNERKAFYTNLGPRTYRFRVTACNNSGVWNETGDTLEFSIDPKYYQATWFRVSCVAAFLVALWALYRYRLHQIARQFNMRMEERVNERTRIARELHDTMLQSFQAVLMKFHALTYRMEDRPEVKETLEAVLEQARQAVTEGRDAVQGLRSSTVVTNDLARAIAKLGEELAAGQTGQNGPKFRVQVEGESRDLPPLIRDEVHRITCEAIRNAFRHAEAQQIEVEIRYDRRQLLVRVKDDGKGIDPNVLGAGGRAGHHGMPGMHERAKLVQGKLAVRSKIDSGTEVELTIPASVAYAKSSVARRSTSSGRGT